MTISYEEKSFMERSPEDAKRIGSGGQVVKKIGSRFCVNFFATLIRKRVVRSSFYTENNEFS